MDEDPEVYKGKDVIKREPQYHGKNVIKITDEKREPEPQYHGKDVIKIADE